MSKHTSASKILLALMAGAGIGAIMGAGAALLLSPNDGKTNRKLLKEKINELSEDLHEKTDSLIDEIQEEIENITISETETE